MRAPGRYNVEQKFDDKRSLPVQHLLMNITGLDAVLCFGLLVLYLCQQPGRGRGSCAEGLDRAASD